MIENSFENAYGLQIKNVAAATDLSDAVTLEQVQSMTSSLQDALTSSDISAAYSN